MKINIKSAGAKVEINWDKVDADLYIIYLKVGDVFSEIARTYTDTFTTLSLLPFGDNEIFIRAFKNGSVVEESQVKKFNQAAIDVVALKATNNEDVQFLYSKYPNAQGYRLYRNDLKGFNGFRNYQTQSITVKATEKSDSYKIKPYRMENGERKILYSSAIFYNPSAGFRFATLYKSYTDNMFLSWIYDGYADGYCIYSDCNSQPVCEISDGKCHFATLKGYKTSIKFKVCAFVNSPEGRIIVDSTDYIKIQKRKYTHPEVSLIIPAYNAEDYIARSIDSALASNFDDLEIIIVNDGSKDKTQEIMDWYAKTYPNIKIAQKTNGGVADTRNFGINMAEGKYIAFLDNDDLIRPEMISSLYTSIIKNECRVAIAPLYRLVDSGYTVHCVLPFEEDKAVDIDDYLEIMYTPGYYNCAIWNKLYDAQMVKDHPLGLLKYEDVSWTPCIISWAEKFCFINKPFYEWDRKTRPETFGNVLAKMPEKELFEHRKQAMEFFINNGNPKRKKYLKIIAQRRLKRYSGQTKNNEAYLNMIKQISAMED